MTLQRARAATGILPVILVPALALTLVTLTPRDATSGSTWTFKRWEKCLMRRTNRFRARRGLRRLSWDKHLGVVARRHARRMARYRTVWHDRRVGRKVTRWLSLAQNTGRARSCRRMFRRLRRSSPHRSNMLGSWRFMGVGTKWRDGRLYVQQIFEIRRDPGNIWNYP